MDEVLNAEQGLRTAMLAGDADALDRLLAEDAIFVDATGTLFAREADLELHRSGRLRLTAIDPLGEASVTLLDGAAIVVTSLRIAGSFDAQPFAGTFTYTRVWHRRDGRWQVAAAHCSAILTTAAA